MHTAIIRGLQNKKFDRNVFLTSIFLLNVRSQKKVLSKKHLAKAHTAIYIYLKSRSNK